MKWLKRQKSRLEGKIMRQKEVEAKTVFTIKFFTVVKTLKYLVEIYDFFKNHAQRRGFVI